MRLFLIALLFASNLIFSSKFSKFNKDKTFLQMDQEIFCKGKFLFFPQTDRILRNF